MIMFVVLGHAQPAGSKTAMPIRRKDGSYVTLPNGKPVTPVVDSNKKSSGWKKEVREVAREAYSGPLLDEPLRVRLTFVRVRPKAHYRTGKNSHLLKDDAPTHPTGKPDVLKLARGVEDALTGVIYRDDSRTVSLEAEKKFGEPECVIVIIERAGEWNGTSLPEEVLRPMRIRVDDDASRMSSMRLDRLRPLHPEQEADSQGSESDSQEVEHAGTTEASGMGARTGADHSRTGMRQVVAQSPNDTH